MRALLLHPEGSPYGYWNYGEVCRLVGAKYPASPLGLITMAALLPRSWELRLVDLNAHRLDDRDIDWADLVFTGGMLTQQSHLLQLIAHVHARGKKVVVGGPDPTSQPRLYRDADHLVLGEAEGSLPHFLADLTQGHPAPLYPPAERLEMTESPVPRFDLLRLRDYVMVGIQTSRGCPYGCEYCDIVELYGRKPRSKTPSQVLRELDALYAVGHRGHVDIVDDNFIGHKPRAKAILRAMKEWSEAHGHPFYYSTEATLNLADDDELLALLQDLDFRYVFIGVESADEETLSSVDKRANLNRDLVRDLLKIQRYGMVVNAGFILGFDRETGSSAAHMIDLIREGRICMAMVGLLYALPNTQLTRRLRSEQRLLADHGAPIADADQMADQISSGLNFVTRRPRRDVIHDLVHVIQSIYSVPSYFDRCLAVCRELGVRPRYKPSWPRALVYVRGFLRTSLRLGLRPSTAWPYWRNVGLLLVTRPRTLETVVSLMAMYLHFRKQSRFIVDAMKARVRDEEVRYPATSSAVPF